MDNLFHQIVEQNNKFQVAIEPSIEMKTVNQGIEIFSGHFEIGHADKRSSLEGKITFQWFPHQAATLTGEVIKEGGFTVADYLKGEWSVYVNGYRCGEVTVTRFSIGTRQYLEAVSFDFFEGDKSIPVEEVLFSLPNFRDYLGTTISSSDALHLTQGRLVFEDDEYTITLDKMFDYQDRYQQITRQGGYLICYSGSIKRHDGLLHHQHLGDLLAGMRLFLSFLNGRRVAPFFLKGVVKGEALWTNYATVPCAEYQSAENWSELSGYNDFSALWRRFFSLWKQTEDRQCLNLGLNWYLDANAGTGLAESRLILTQAALELFYNWLVVETRQMIVGRDATQLNADNKIRLLLSVLKIDPAIPEIFSGLRNYANNQQDAPETLVGVRNALVHGNKTKRSALAALDAQTRNEALQLALGYVELAILFVLGYEGNYRSRTRNSGWKDEGMVVPWRA